jgi:hypothetical protein
MQTKREGKNRTKVIRRSRQSTKQLHRKKQSPQSSIASKAIGGAVFRPDLLGIHITNKSGSFVPELGFEEDPFADKIQIIEYWYRTLKNHSKIKELKVDENASLNEVLDLLKKTTDNLFKGYEWILKMNPLMESYDIYYYKQYDEIYMMDLPLEWMDKHKNPLIRELCLYMIRGLCQKFKIDCIRNNYTYYELEEFNSKGDVITHLLECLDEDEADIENNEIYKNYVLYTEGRPAELHRQLRNMNFSGRMYSQRLELIKESHPRIYNWLKMGVELLQDDFNIYDFDFAPDHLPDENDYNEAIKVPDCFWFPYSDRDAVYNKAIEFFEDSAMNQGINAVHEYGYLKAQSFRKPVPYSKLEKLFKFFKRGNKINPLKRKNR